MKVVFIKEEDIHGRHGRMNLVSLVFSVYIV
jgi:hypothetical protein